MVNFATEMQKRKMTLPLLIGGATTSRVHTAVKIAPSYSGPVVHVLDASRSVPVVSSLLSLESRDRFAQETRENYTKLQESYKKNSSDRSLVSIAEARENQARITKHIAIPKNLGIKTFHSYSLSELRSYIDWTPFFQTWVLHGPYPEILSDALVGKEAKNLFDDAQHMLDEVCEHNMLCAKGVVGIFPANRVGDDVEIYDDISRSKTLTTFHFLRQQSKKSESMPNYCLADFVAPKDQGETDYLGAFAVSAGFEIEKWIQQYERDHDDYRSILIKALADRLAEAFAERMHMVIRQEIWGYKAEEALSNDDLIQERYQA